MMRGLVRLAAAIGVMAPLVLPASAASADDVRDRQWYLKTLDVTAAHRITQGEGIVVAVVDSGVEPHRDLAGRLLDGATVVPGSKGNGQHDEDGHGTAMAGLIAGRGHGNGAGVLGIAPKAKILPIKVEQGKKYAGSPAIARGIETALDRGARIINVSLAAAPSDELDAAMGRASREGAVVVAGIGNTGANLRGGYPAVMREALAVGASGRNGERDGISVKDPAVALCAPGAQIPDLGLNHKYVLSRGTSNSTAIVSGAAALVWDKFPDLSAPEVMHRLTATADDNGPPGRDDQCGYGVLNIVKALTADVPPLPTSTPTSTPGTEPPTSAPAAQATPEPRSSNVPAIAGGALGTLLVGGLVTLLVTRRRRSAAPDR